MWKNILKARSRKEDYARLVEGLDKILEGEVEPVEVDIKSYLAKYDFGEYRIILTPMEPTKRNQIALRPLSPHDEFITRLYEEEYIDNFPRLMNHVKKLVYKEEARPKSDEESFYDMIISTLEIVVDAVVTIVTNQMWGEGNNMNNALLHKRKMRKEFAPGLSVRDFKFAFPSGNPEIGRVWRYAVSSYMRNLARADMVSPKEVNSYHNFLLLVGLDDILGNSRRYKPLSEYWKIFALDFDEEEGMGIEEKIKSRLENHPEIQELFYEEDDGGADFDSLADLFR